MFFFMSTKAAMASSDHQNLCKLDEIEVASCSLAHRNKKTASMCANLKKGSISYYFGTKEKIELDAEFTYNRKIYRWLDTTTHTTFLGFNREGYSYIFGVPQETLGATAFFYIKKSNFPIDFNSPELCTQNSFGEKSLVLEAISDVDDRTVRESNFLFPPISLKSIPVFEKPE